jgi:hypothetical protein
MQNHRHVVDFFFSFAVREANNQFYSELGFGVALDFAIAARIAGGTVLGINRGLACGLECGVA